MGTGEQGRWVCQAIECIIAVLDEIYQAVKCVQSVKPENFGDFYICRLAIFCYTSHIASMSFG